MALVTGAASGIGKATVERLLAEGASIVAVDVQPSDEQDRVVGVVGSVADPAVAEEAVATAVDRFGGLHVVANIAGILRTANAHEHSLDMWQQVLDVNLTGTFHCCQVVLPHMLEAGWGRIVNISSSSAQGGQPMMAHYVSSKAAVIGLTKSLALEFGPKGITVNTIPPGFIDTPMLRDSESKGLLGGPVEDIEARTPVRRVGQPHDIAAATAFLVSEDASYVTGQVIGVNGGRNT